MTIHDFADHEEIKKWNVRTDLDEGVGESTAELVPSGHGSVIFRGQISSKIVNQNTSYNRSGFAIMFSERLRGSFLMPAYQKGWTNFTHILLRIRGDGRFYEIRFHTPDHDHHHWVSKDIFYFSQRFRICFYLGGHVFNDIIYTRWSLLVNCENPICTIFS